VTPPPIPELSEASTALCFALILLVPLAGAGLSLINTGLGRSRSAAHSMMTSLVVIATAAVVYFVCGFSWQGFVGRPAHLLAIADTGWNWIAAEPFFMRGLAKRKKYNKKNSIKKGREKKNKDKRANEN